MNYDDLWKLDHEHVMQTYGRQPVAFVRGDGTRLLGNRRDRNRKVG